MRCFVIVLVVNLYLCNNGGYGKELWEGSHNRKLLLLGGAPVTDKSKSVFSVTSDKGLMTAVVFRDQLIALPGIVANPKVGGTALERKSSNGGWTFWSYKDVTVEPFGDHYTGDAAPTGTCEIVGSKNNVSVKISSTTDDAFNVEATSGKICFAELGAPMQCDGKLVGLVHHLLPNGTQNKTEKVAEEEETTVGEEETKETFPGTDKPEDEETPPPKDRKKRDDDQSEADADVKEDDNDEKKNDKKADKKDKKEDKKEDKKSSGECSNLCEVTPMGKISDKPEVIKGRKGIRARSGGVMSKIIKIDSLLILLFSSLILLI